MQILCPEGGTVATENYHCLHLKITHITNEQFVHVRKFKPLKKNSCEINPQKLMCLNAHFIYILTFLQMPDVEVMNNVCQNLFHVAGN